MSNAPPLTVDQAIAQAKKAIRQRRFADAAALYQSILRQQPDHPIAKKGLRKLERSGKPLSDEPEAAEIDALIERLDAGDFGAVLSACRQRIRALPRSVLLRNLLGTALQRSGDAAAAIEVFDALIADQPGFAEAHVNRGVALRDAGRIEDATAAYRQAIAIQPRHALANYNLGNAYKDLGDFDAAIRSYEAAIGAAPEFAAAHRNLAALRRYEPGDEHLEQMRSLWGRSSGAARSELGFALASIEESFENYDKSFEYLEEANRLRRAELGYSIEEDARLFERIRACRIEALPPNSQPADPRPIFVVGMMRSGTTLVEQILASHSAVHGGGELEALNRLLTPTLLDGRDDPAFGSEDAAELRRLYLEDIRSRNVREKVVTDKMPLNFRWLGFALSAFPEARVVHVRRDPRAVCWSIYKHYFPDEGNAYAYDLEDIAGYYGLYRDLMEVWGERFSDRILDLSYESLTAEQERETRRLLEFCDLPWEPACLEFHKTRRAVTTSSATQVRRAMYQGSSDAWRNYAPQLAVLADALGDATRG